MDFDEILSILFFRKSCVIRNYNQLRCPKVVFFLIYGNGNNFDHDKGLKLIMIHGAFLQVVKKLKFSYIKKLSLLMLKN